MASWTTPLTWTASVVTVANLNQQLRDNTLHLYESKGNVRAVSSKTGTYTATVNDGLILCNGTFTVNLMAAATAGAGFVLQVKNIGTGTITIDPNSTETVDGAATVTLNIRYASLTLACDGSNWHII